MVGLEGCEIVLAFEKVLTTTDVYIKDVLFLFFVLHEQNIFIMSAQKWSIFVAHYP